MIDIWMSVIVKQESIHGHPSDLINWDDVDRKTSQYSTNWQRNDCTVDRQNPIYLGETIISIWQHVDANDFFFLIYSFFSCAWTKNNNSLCLTQFVTIRRLNRSFFSCKDSVKCEGYRSMSANEVRYVFDWTKETKQNLKKSTNKM